MTMKDLDFVKWLANRGYSVSTSLEFPGSPNSFYVERIDYIYGEIILDYIGPLEEVYQIYLDEL